MCFLDVLTVDERVLAPHQMVEHVQKVVSLGRWFVFGWKSYGRIGEHVCLCSAFVCCRGVRTVQAVNTFQRKAGSAKIPTIAGLQKSW